MSVSVEKKKNFFFHLLVGLKVLPCCPCDFSGNVQDFCAPRKPDIALLLTTSLPFDNMADRRYVYPSPLRREGGGCGLLGSAMSAMFTPTLIKSSYKEKVANFILFKSAPVY